VSDSDGIRELERELNRVVDRLTSMPLARAESAAADCRRAALVLIEQTRRLTDDIPIDAALPELGPQGLGSMLAVLGGDYLTAARASSEPDLGPALDALVALRRALP
jgi:hypothetical protein